VLPGLRTQTSYTGTVPAGTDVLVAEDSSHWALDVSGHGTSRQASFGWASRYPAGEGGHATLSYKGPLLRYLAVLLEIALWVLVIREIRRRRREVSA
jgi:hypothetical protein